MLEETDAHPDPDALSLEAALSKAEAGADAVLKAAAAVTTAAKRYHAAARLGNLRDLETSAGSAEQAATALRQAVKNARESWQFDEDAYFAGDAYIRELLETAARMNVRLYEQDDRVYSYPSLVRLLPNERAVLVDKTRERRLRPSVLVGHLRDLQKKPVRFRPEAFLEALYTAYETLAAKRSTEPGAGLQPGVQGPVIRLLEIYELFTLLPGQSRDYSRQEFARDIYLLDQSGVTATRRGHRVSFPASTGTRAPSSVVRVVTQDGEEKVYYGIAFTRAGD